MGVESRSPDRESSMERLWSYAWSDNLDTDPDDMRGIGIVTYFEFYFYLASPFSVHPQSKGCVSDYTF